MILIADGTCSTQHDPLAPNIEIDSLNQRLTIAMILLEKGVIYIP